MDDLQYFKEFETAAFARFKVLNLVINGWPSIHVLKRLLFQLKLNCFKPCYKWMTFNTILIILGGFIMNEF